MKAEGFAWRWTKRPGAAMATRPVPTTFCYSYDSDSAGELPLDRGVLPWEQLYF